MTGDRRGRRLEDDDAALRRALSAVRTIAVVGIKDDPGADAYRIPAYLQARGYRIRGVNPTIAGRVVLGAPVVAALAEVGEPIDAVNLWRAPAYVPAHAEEVLALSPRPALVWMQLGVHSAVAAERLTAEGIDVVQDLCLMVEHRRLLG